MELGEVKTAYRDLLQPVFGELFRMDDSEEERNWIVIILDGKQEDFYLSLYGTDCVRLYWCNECFIFSKRRHDLVSSDTYGEIVFEGHFDAEDLPRLITGLILQLKDCAYMEKRESVKGNTPSGYDDIKDYVITARANTLKRQQYRLANITIEFRD